VETVAAGEAAPNEVVAELLRGYWFHERVLRPALVRVAVEEATAGSSGTGGREG
jgi:molecular chaperone GrpE (heat shock protein)